MDEQKLVHDPHVGPDPVAAKPNHVREKTYREPNVPGRVQAEQQVLPENTAKDKVREEMRAAASGIIDKI